MKKNRIYIAAVALLALAGCNKEMSSEATGAITVNASIGIATKVVYNGDDASFTAGDQIAVYAWMGSASEVPAQRVVDGVKNAFDGTNWTPEKQMRWKTVTDPHYFLGVYPVKEITDFKADAYTLNPADYTASDLLIATNLGGVKASDGPVALEFDHVMAKLNVNLKFRSQWNTTPDVTSVTVKARKTATVDYLTKTVTATGDAEAVGIPAVAAVTGYARSYSSLEVPQTGVREIVVTIDGKEYTYTAQDDIPLESGKYTTLALYVGKDKLELASVSVNNWTEGTILPDGDARTKEAYAYVDMGEVTIGGKTRNLKWATCNIGAENPWDNGGYFAWGETETKSNYIWATYRYGDSFHDFSRYTGHDYATLRDEDDAACQIWGGEWRTPTAEEWTALLDDALYTWEWTDDYLGDGSKHAGQIVTRKSGTGPCSGNSIFLPASGCMSMTAVCFWGDGYYWTSTLDDWSPSIACNIEFSSSSFSKTTAPRYVGYSIRPVLK